MQKLNGVIEKIEKIVFLSVFLTFILLAGSPVKNNCNWLYLITILLGIIIMMVKKIILKQKVFFINKIDIFVVLLTISSFLPVIFRTYLDLNDALSYIAKYVTAYFMYLFARDTIKGNKKNIDTFIHTFLFIGVIVIFLGFDNITYNHFYKLFDALNLVYVYNMEHRIVSIFGYANAYAIFASIIFILAICQYTKGTNFYYQCIYMAIAYISFTSILLSYSRATILLLMILLLGYYLFIKDKTQKQKLLILEIVIFLYAFVYLMIFENLRIQKEYLILWCLLGVFTVITIICVLILRKYEPILIRIKWKVILSILFVLVGGFLIFFILGINLYAPDIIFNNNKFIESVKYQIKNLEPDQYYKVEVNMEAKVKSDKEIYNMEIVEKDKAGKAIKRHGTNFGNFEGTKIVDFVSTPETRSISVKFTSLNNNLQLYILINNIKVNGKEYPVAYQYLSKKMVDKVLDLNFKSVVVTERINYIQKGIETLKDNWLFGLGGNGWIKYCEKNTILNEITQMHSYPLQIFIEFGILSIIAYIGLLIILVINLGEKRKNIDIVQLSFYMILGLLIIHSSIDFEMSFSSILILFYIFVAMINLKEDKIYLLVKRGIDIILSLLGMILFLPLAIIIAVFIKIDSKGPVFFRQERMGSKGKKIKIIKFRTMVQNAEELKKNFNKAQREEYRENYKLLNDFRVTKFGKVLRKLRIDELPQLFNILCGDMSFIGPRPVVENEVEKYKEKKQKLLSVKPGLTGMWASEGNNTMEYDERIKLELYYVDNISFVLDLKIMWKTILVIVKRRGV